MVKDEIYSIASAIDPAHSAAERGNLVFSSKTPVAVFAAVQKPLLPRMAVP
jgi:hypothetical protein